MTCLNRGGWGLAEERREDIAMKQKEETELCKSDRGSFICLLDLTSWSLQGIRLFTSIFLH